ncbi:uncharacterized protein [Miscanthus floridulus]|uniref:uncharacterized protein n=1 Tax=Miscanthus floridulus TaxID=154761 RepID=UPI003457BA2B
MKTERRARANHNAKPTEQDANEADQEKVGSPENKINTNVRIVNGVSARSLETKTKDLHPFILEGRKRNELGTCDSDDEMPKGKLCMKECHWLRDCVLFKE